VNRRQFRVDSGHLESDERVGGQGGELPLAAERGKFLQPAALGSCGGGKQVVLQKEQSNDGTDGKGQFRLNQLCGCSSYLYCQAEGKSFNNFNTCAQREMRF
jgi:hypothetical protein